jgi:hypothetical protein
MKKDKLSFFVCDDFFSFVLSALGEGRKRKRKRGINSSQT